MAVQLDRRTLLGGSVAALSRAAEPPASSYVYKSAGTHQIKADVYRPADQLVRPVLVWIHGGALINGHREAVSDPVRQWAREAGYVLVSIDYRLAPETQLPDIIRDVEDAYAWVRREGPRLFQAHPERLVVAGGSAGGYLTLTTGFRVKPRPRALLSLWGYGDLIGDWYSTPSPHARHRTTMMTREQAYAQVSGPAISDSRERKGDGGAFYQHCRQNGTWPTAVTGWDPKRQAARFHPYMPVKNVTRDFPPTVLIHGTEDTDVPHEQSVLMAAELRRHGVQNEFISVPGAEHGLPGGDRATVNAAYQKAFAFVDRALSQKAV